MRLEHSCRLAVAPSLAAFWMFLLPGAALSQDCSPPKQAAKASLELRHGDYQLVHDLDAAGIGDIVDEVKGYVAGPWHIPIGLTVAEFDTRYETKFYYREAQPFGHCVALSEAKVSTGYDDITVYVSSEYPEGSCEYETILAHEQEHVRINRELLKTYKAEFQKALARILQSKKVIFAHRKGEARSAYILELRRQVKAVVAEMLNARNLKNGAIDTQDNYRRLLARCDNWRIDALRTSGLQAPAEHAAGAEPLGATQEASLSEVESPSDPVRAGTLEALDGQDTMLAQSGTTDQDPKTDPDPADLLRQGRELSKANARQLESALKSLPYDFPARARLLGYYFHNGLTGFGRAATIEARRRHILWLIENHPDSPVAALPEAMIDPVDRQLADQEGYQQAKAVWLEQVEKHKDKEAVRQNAARFLMSHDEAIAESLI